MDHICSLTSSCFSAKDVQETTFSKMARVAVIIGGIVAIVIAGFIAYRGQLTIGMGILAGGISFICVAAIIKCVKKTQGSNLQADAIPDDIWFKFFTFLNIRDLGRSGQVSKNWKFIIDQRIWPAFWQKNPDVFYDFKPFIDKGRLTWKQVGEYAHFSEFLRRINEHLHSNRDFIKSKNPKLNNKEFPQVYIPKPWVSSGCYDFWIADSSEITMQKKDGTQSHVFEGDKEKHFCCLAVEGPFLFALHVDGLVVQWNYLTKEKVQSIETSYMKEEPLWQTIKSEVGAGSPCEADAFHVQDGYVVLKYGDRRHYTFEILSYHFPHERDVITDADIASRDKIFIRENMLYMLQDAHLYIWDIKKKAKLPCLKIEVERADYLNDFVLKKNYIYTSSINGNVCKTDLSGGVTTTLWFIKGNRGRYSIMTVSNKFLYGFDGTDIYMRDLSNNNYISTRAIFKPGAHEIRAGILENLIKNEQSVSQMHALVEVD